MWPVSSRFLAALRQSHRAVFRLDAYLGSTLLASDIPFEAGMVTVNGGTGVRRTLSVTITDRDMWDVLITPGVDLLPYRGIQFPGTSTPEMVPLGKFRSPQKGRGLTVDAAAIKVQSAPDWWHRIQRAGIEKPVASITTNMIRTEIVRLATVAVPGLVATSTATMTVKPGPMVWEWDRAAAINDLATSIGAEVYFDNVGVLVLRDAPLLSAPPVWTVDASPTGVLLGGDESRDESRTYNVVVAYPSSVTGQALYAPVVVADTDPTSPTYVGGNYGRVPLRWTTPSMTTAVQAAAAGRTILNRIKAINAQLSVESVVNPALDRGDVITVLKPDGTTERHLVDSVTVPLDITSAQQITTRSSRPEGDVPGEE